MTWGLTWFDMVRHGGQHGFIFSCLGNYVLQDLQVLEYYPCLGMLFVFGEVCFARFTGPSMLCVFGEMLFVFGECYACLEKCYSCLENVIRVWRNVIRVWRNFIRVWGRCK